MFSVSVKLFPFFVIMLPIVHYLFLIYLCNIFHKYIKILHKVDTYIYLFNYLLYEEKLHKRKIRMKSDSQDFII